MSKNIKNLLVRLDDKDLDKIQGLQGLMVACSGGLDSTVMLENLREIQKFQKKLKISVCHINFHLRDKESDGDEKFVEAISSKFGFDFNKLDAPSKSESSNGESTQEWARRIRYEYFDQFIKNGWAICLAHHKDDLAENIIFRLIRGAFPENLLGMERWSWSYFRPLLNVYKKEIESYAIKNQINYRSDSSNEKLDYSRNRIRHLVLPELENLSKGAKDRMIQTAIEANKYANKLKAAYSDKNKFDDYIDLKICLEAKTGNKITMSKAEWEAAFKWSESIKRLPLDETVSYGCSSGTIIRNATGFNFLDFHEFKLPEKYAKEVAYDNVWHIRKPGSVKVKLEWPHSGFIEFVASEGAAKIEMFSMPAGVERLKAKDSQKLSSFLNKILKLSNVEKHTGLAVKVNDQLCAIFVQNQLFDFNKGEGFAHISWPDIEIKYY